MENVFSNEMHAEEKRQRDYQLAGIFAARPYREKFESLYKTSKTLKSFLHFLSAAVGVFGLSVVIGYMANTDFTELSVVLNGGSAVKIVKYSLIFGFSAVLLFFMERLKGRSLMFYKRDRLSEKEKAQTAPFKMAMVLSTINVILSIIGAWVLVNTVLNTRGAEALAAVDQRHQPIIEKLEKEVTELTGDSYRNSRGKILYKHLPVVKTAQTALSDARAKYEKERRVVIQKHGVDDTAEAGNDQSQIVIGSMLAIQLIIEMGLFFLIGFIAQYEYKSALEIFKERGGILPSYSAPVSIPALDFTGGEDEETEAEEGTPDTGGLRAPSAKKEIGFKILGPNAELRKVKKIKIETRHGVASYPPSVIKQKAMAKLEAGKIEEAKELFSKLYRFYTTS